MTGGVNQKSKMEKAIQIVEAKLAVVEGLIDNLSDGKAVDSFLSRKYILFDILKELKWKK